MKTFKQYVSEDWKRAVAMGTVAMAAGAATASAVGFPIAAGAAISGVHYALTKDGLRQDLAHKIRKVKKKTMHEQNDNPDPKDEKNAQVDTRRRYMSSKTDDEREFYKRKLNALTGKN